jgi:hypothetical protein
MMSEIQKLLLVIAACLVAVGVVALIGRSRVRSKVIQARPHVILPLPQPGKKVRVYARREDLTVETFDVPQGSTTEFVAVPDEELRQLGFEGAVRWARRAP